MYPFRASLVAQMAKNLPAMQEMQVQSLDQGDPLEKEMAIHSSILACRIPWTKEPGGLQSDSAIPWTVVRQAPPSMGFSRQEYWSGMP